jgi:hypothetical protein
MKSSGRLPHQAADKGSKEKRHLPGAIVQSEVGTSGEAAHSAIRDPRRLFAARNGDGVKDSSGRSDLDADDGRRPAVRRLRSWAISVLEAGSIRECEEHGSMQDSANPHSCERALVVACQDPPFTVSPDVAVAAVKDVLDLDWRYLPRVLPAPSCFAEVALNVGDFRQAAARLTILGAPGHGLRPPASWPLPLGPQVVMRCLAY